MGGQVEHEAPSGMDEAERSRWRALSADVKRAEDLAADLHGRTLLAGWGVVPIATIPAERIDWAWRGRLAFGKLTDLSGDAGDGKSLMVTALAAQITRGFALPFGAKRIRDPRAVLYFSAEDDAADTIRPRFEAAGGDVNLMHVLRRECDGPILPGDVDALRDMVKALRAGMVVFDPVFSYIGDLDSNAYGAAVAVCDPLRRVAAETGAIFVNVRHVNKAAGMAARFRASGSYAWTAKPRVALTLARDPDDKGVRVLAPIKGNVAGEPKAATFRVEVVPFQGEEVARVLWGPESSVTADELHGAEGAAPKARGVTASIVTYLRDRLVSAGDEGLAWEPLVQDVLRAGFTRTRQTVYDARTKLGDEVVTFKPDDGAVLRVRLRSPA
jgi:hypothetical protein